MPKVLKSKWKFLVLLLVSYSCRDSMEFIEREPCEPGTDQIWIILAVPSLFNGCEYHVADCNEQKIDEFVSKNIHYPQLAREYGIEGNVVVQGIIEKKGCFSIEGITESLGYGCDEEAIRLINLMPKWTPAKKDGNPERLRTFITVKFRL